MIRVAKQVAEKLAEQGCQYCGGTGFEMIQENGTSAARLCRCRSKAKRAKAQGIGRDEMNLCEVALCDFGAARHHKQTVLVREIDQPGGYKIAITAEGDSKLGLPTPADMDLMVVLEQLSREAGFPDEVGFEPPYLLERLGHKPDRDEDKKTKKISGTFYEIRRNGFRRLKALTFSQWSGWFDNTQKGPVCVGQFSLIDQWWWPTEKEIKDGADPKCFFSWGRPILKSIRANFVKSLDLNVYWSLGDPIARFVYRYVDRHLYRRDQHTVATASLYQDILGLRWKSDSPQMMVKVLENHLGELEEKVGIKVTIGLMETKFQRVKRK